MSHIAVLILTILASLLIATLGKYRKMGFWGYLFASLLLTPIMGLLLLLASDPRPKDKV
jgi:hypothetical protein